MDFAPAHYYLSEEHKAQLEPGIRDRESGYFDADPIEFYRDWPHEIRREAMQNFTH